MKINHVHHMRARRGFSLVELLVVIAIIAGLAAMSYGPIMKQMKQGKKTQAISQAKNLLTALNSFAKDNDGIFPSEDTARNEESGSNAEDCFNQLIYNGYVDNEKLFWNSENAVLGKADSNEPDNDGELSTGENVWGYVAGLSQSSRTTLPIFFDSSVSAGQFSTEVWDGSAIVAKLDASVASLNIDVQGKGFINEDGSFKKGPIKEKKGNREYDIFSNAALPQNTDVYAPGGGGSISRVND
ncbi:type II secretion system protein [Rubritalea sp.]|uniref:type II secretion system protein n=1 Tax=Rubritalea sp. TaxID=2109375 RepID=UPI003EF355C6